MSAYEIGVQMRFDNVTDLEIVCFCFVEILIDVTLRVDDYSFTF